MLHNYFHLLPGAASENEFDFKPERFRYFLSVLTEPSQAIQAVFSYLGHFGVQLFIFLSAYGLAVKYWRTPSWTRFVWSRVRKIYPTWFLTVGLYLLVKLAEHGPHGLEEVVRRQWDDVLFTTVGVYTLLPPYGFPPVGPWWFLPFIMQFYCLWGPLTGFVRRFGGVGLTVLAILSLSAGSVVPMTLKGFSALRILTTPLGHLPEIALGIGCARLGLRLGRWSAAAAAGFFLLGNLYAWFWPLTHVSALVLLLYAYQQARGVLRQSNALHWIGLISMPLFFVNGFLREPFWAIGRSGEWYAAIGAGLAFAVVSLALASAVSLVGRGRGQQE